MPTSPPDGADRPRRRRLIERSLVGFAVAGACVLTLVLAIEIFTGEDPPSNEVIETEIAFAEASGQMLGRPATLADVERLLPSLLGPTDDVGATTAALGAFPALDEVPADAEIVLVEHRVTASSETSLSVAFVTSSDLGSAMAAVERSLEAAGAPVVTPILHETFPHERSERPPNRNRWVVLAGVTLDDGRSWIGMSYRTRLEEMFPGPRWRSGLFPDDALPIETLARVVAPVSGAPEPIDRFVDTGAVTPGSLAGETATIVVVERVGGAAAFDDVVDRLRRQDGWFVDEKGDDIDVSAVYADPVAAREFVTDDRRAQLIVATGRNVRTVFTTLTQARVVPMG